MGHSESTKHVPFTLLSQKEKDEQKVAKDTKVIQNTVGPALCRRWRTSVASRNSFPPTERRTYSKA
jgi:hypothetical protein